MSVSKQSRFLLFLFPLVATGNSPAQNGASVFEKSKDAIVTVSTSTGSGTGFIIENGTLLVTCYHVTEGDSISSIEISLKGVQVAARYAWDADADIVIYSLTKKAPKSLTLHSTGLLSPGKKIFVIGTPLGFLSNTITEGIVSGIRRDGPNKMLQITAPISPGNSGSPVLDAEGSVVGMVQGSITEGQSLNFAISAQDIRRIQRNGLGEVLTTQELDQLEAKYRRAVWPPGNPRLAELASKLDSEMWGDEAAKKLSKYGSKAVPYLIRALDFYQKDLDALIRAQQSLCKIGSAALRPLISALTDFKRTNRHWIAYTLGELKDKRATEPLITALRDKNSDVAAGAAFALGNIRDIRGVKPLISTLSAQNAEIRYQAAKALGAIGDRAALEPLKQLLLDVDEDVRKAAEKAIDKITSGRVATAVTEAGSDFGESRLPTSHSLNPEG
ncbi:MAG: trypsin-like peptidase domain-containing protein [Fimbriimonadales bacterium]